ncbi:MAG TPA: hypothetical protein VG733_19960, partial [Chthoniobacteraceae bacterium]|nr:hypothetical protein [Chthoniobacteraceae bacterium]
SSADVAYVGGPVVQTPARSTSKSTLFSKSPSGMFLCDGWPALHIVFIPAETVMRVFPGAYRFYFWEYYTAGGK